MSVSQTIRTMPTAEASWTGFGTTPHAHPFCPMSAKLPLVLRLVEAVRLTLHPTQAHPSVAARATSQLLVPPPAPYVTVASSLSLEQPLAPPALQDRIRVQALGLVLPALLAQIHTQGRKVRYFNSYFNS